jgi:hypothetical protein
LATLQAFTIIDHQKSEGELSGLELMDENDTISLRAPLVFCQAYSTAAMAVYPRTHL